MKQTPQPSDLELQVLSVLWEQGPCTVRDVLQKMPDGKSRAYTTILSSMQVMEKKGLLTHDREGQTHVYRPLVAQHQILKPLVRGWLTNVFGGKASTALQYLLSEGDLDPGELEKIRQLLDENAQPSQPQAMQKARRKEKHS